MFCFQCVKSLLQVEIRNLLFLSPLPKESGGNGRLLASYTTVHFLFFTMDHTGLKRSKQGRSEKKFENCWSSGYPAMVNSFDF